MEELCGSGGGWPRIAYLNMTNASQNCPPGLRIYQSGVVRACGRPESFSGSCTSVEFPSNGISYSQVCGRVIGYQVGTTDAVGIGHNRGNGGLNSYYVDGISITHGLPCIHVWTAMAGWSGKSMTESLYCCPCSTGCTQAVPKFIGNNFFCELGNQYDRYPNGLFEADPLWDGKGCGSIERDCCSVPGIP